MVPTLLRRRGSRPLPSRRLAGPPPLALRLAAWLAVPLVVYALYATGQKALENYRLNQQADRLESDVRSLRDENLRLQSQIVEARSDVAIETIAREDLGLVKPGDTPLTLLPAGGQKATAEAPPPPEKSTPPPWQQWRDLVFGPPRP